MGRHGAYKHRRKHDPDDVDPDDVVELEPFSQAETA